MKAYLNNQLAKVLLQILAAVALVLVGACSQESPLLEKIVYSSYATISGDYKTNSPFDTSNPVKVLFAIDTSGSMNSADPSSLRIEAVKDFVDTYQTDDNLMFEVQLWNAGVEFSTKNDLGQNGFSDDIDHINSTLDDARNGNGTSYSESISEIQRNILNDINEYGASSYIVVFLSDGEPSVGITDTPSIVSMVSTLKETVLSAGARGFQMNTFILGENPKTEYTSLMSEMALVGDGTFSVFSSAVDIDFVESIGIRVPVNHIIKSFNVYNYNVKQIDDVLLVDTDGDGLVDETEIKIGTDPYLPDTDFDGLSDFIEYTASSIADQFDPLVDEGYCTASDKLDSDSDNLTNCEEFVKETNPLLVDTDADGVPDHLEVLSGTNPNHAEGVWDSDSDGRSDLEEVKLHTNVQASDDKSTRRYEYDYTTEYLGYVAVDSVNSDGTDLAPNSLNNASSDEESQARVKQYNFEVSNIRLMKTLETNGTNTIGIWVGQVPEDSPQDPPTFHVFYVTLNTLCGEHCLSEVDWSQAVSLKVED